MCWSTKENNKPWIGRKCCGYEWRDSRGLLAESSRWLRWTLCCFWRQVKSCVDSLSFRELGEVRRNRNECVYFERKEEKCSTPRRVDLQQRVWWLGWIDWDGSTCGWWLGWIEWCGLDVWNIRVALMTWLITNLKAFKPLLRKLVLATEVDIVTFRT